MLEANLLFNSSISINIGEPLDINKKIKEKSFLLNKIPFLNDKRKENLVLKMCRQKLTYEMAVKIYNNLTVNIEHLFAFYLYETNSKEITVYKLKRFIVRAILFLLKNSKNNLGNKLTSKEILTLFVPRKYLPFELIVELGKQQGILTEDGKKFLINLEALNKPIDFYNAPIKAPFKVIYNEFLSMTKIIYPLRNILQENAKEVDQSFAEEIIKLDEKAYYKDFQDYYDDKSSKYEYGSPFFLKSKSVKVGVVFSHGYLACPREIKDVAEPLNINNDIAVYGVRLAGHGTAPRNIKDITWKDWLQSYWNGVAATLNEYDYLFLGGFSTGGLLSLICASELGERVAGTFAINPPINLQDVRSQLVPVVNVWNDVLNKFKLNSLKYEYIENNPTYSDTNYTHNYLKGVGELSTLIKVAKKRLNKVTMPTLVINSSNDSIVNPVSSQYIYDKIQSEDKQLYTVDTQEHVIVRGKYQPEVTKTIVNFINKTIG